MEGMKTIARILILLDFAAIVFIPSIYMNRLTMIPLFLTMVGLVALYWYAMFWVGKKDVLKVLGKQPEFDIFVGKIPADPNADLLRGRMCIMDGRLVIMQRTDDKVHHKTPCKEAWSLDICAITSVGFGKVLPARKGFILYMGDDEVSFTCSKIAKDHSILYRALGWNMEESKTSS